jgi:hypothetical protein
MDIALFTPDLSAAGDRHRSRTNVEWQTRYYGLYRGLCAQPPISASRCGVWTLIAYLTSNASMKACGQSCLTLPARRSVLAELGYSRHPLYQAFVAGVAHATIWQVGETLSTI